MRLSYGLKTIAINFTFNELEVVKLYLNYTNCLMVAGWRWEEAKFG